MSLPTAPRTGQAAVDEARSRVGGRMPDSGLCLQFTRQNYDVPSYYASAIDAWNAADEQHPGDYDPPPSAPVWFWSTSVYRHVAFHLGDGQYVTTYNDEIRTYGLASMESIFGPLIGWAPDLNQYSVRPPPTPPAQEEDMTPEEHAMLADVVSRVRGPDPNADMLQLIKQGTDDTWQRVRGPDPNADMLQLIKSSTDHIPPAAPATMSWTPPDVVALIVALTLVALVIAGIVLVAIGNGATEVQSALIYLAFALIGGLLTRLLPWRRR